jgi:hypothetical protein
LAMIDFLHCMTAIVSFVITKYIDLFNG